MSGDLDVDGYPTEATVQRIETWTGDVNACLDAVAGLWAYQEFGVSRVLRPEERVVLHAAADERFLRLATAGWSGNETLIGALRRNRLVWLLTWRLSSCGGLHIFRYVD